ncbi:MAG: hypothetical protein AB1489_30190 [Acidobacteriota bacterium]
MSIFSSVWQFLSVVRLPRVATGFVDNSLVALELRKRRNQLNLERIGSVVLPKSLVKPDFSEPNIADPTSLANLLRQVAEEAGLTRESRWSIALPEGVASSLVINFDNQPESRQELEEMTAWKVERVLGVESAQLRLVRQQISSVGPPRFLVTAVHESVIAEYEAVFRLLGWHTGLIMPRHIGESLWLARDGEKGDKLLVSHSDCGFVAIGLHNEEPVMIRSRSCDLSERENELYRLAIYYREKFAQEKTIPLRILTLGGEYELELTQRTFADAFNDRKFHFLTPAQLSLNIANPGLSFSQLAATAGIASLAYN